MTDRKHSHDGFLGMQLKHDIFNKVGVLVAPAFTVLNQAELGLLESHGISLEEQDVQPVLLSEGGSSHDEQDLIDESVIRIREIFEDIRYMKQVPLLEIREKIVPMIHETTEQPNVFRLFDSLHSKDDYTYRHNIAVGIISNLIGKWMGLKESELLQLSIAATLHDVGKVKIPLEILNKPDKLTDDEFSLMKKHSIFGYEMMKETVGTNHRQALVALQHHERQDGSGYPFGIKGDKIDLFSRVVTVADVFHAMTSRRPYRNALSLYETLVEMHQHTFGILDPQIIHLMMNNLMQSLVGNEVLLTDGRRGVIIMINPHDPFQPLLQIGETFLDLSKESDLHIEKVII